MKSTVQNTRDASGNHLLTCFSTVLTLIAKHCIETKRYTFEAARSWARFVTFCLWHVGQAIISTFLRMWEKIIPVANQKEEIFVIFGSQTGTAEEYAYRLSGRLKGIDVEHCVLDGIQVSPTFFTGKKKLFFIVSTHGVGEPPDNIAHVFQFLKEASRKRKSFTSLSHAIFGLGDSAYTDYNSAAKCLSSLMEAVCSQNCHPLTLGDTSYNLDVSFEKWTKSILQSHFSRPVEDVVNGDERDVRSTLGQKSSETEAFVSCPLRDQPTRHALMQLALKSSELLTPGSSKVTRLLRFESSSLSLDYEPGDHLGCFAPNPPKLVEVAIKRILMSEIDLYRRVSDFIDLSGTPIAMDCSVALFLRWHADLHGPPRREALRQMIPYISDISERSRFQSEVETTGAQKSPNMTNLLDVVERFSSLSLPLKDFLAFVPLQSPRLYSICNYHRVDACLSIAVSVTAGGLCSPWLCSRRAGDTVPIFITKSHFHLSFQEISRDVFFICTGTGIAPFMGFLQKKHFWKNGKTKADAKFTRRSKKHEKSSKASSENDGELSLLFGCRTTKDFLFARTLKRVQDCTGVDPDFKAIYHQPIKDGGAHLPVEGRTSSLVLDQVHVAFSREPPNCYVQSRMDDLSEGIWRNITNNGIIFICGDALQMCVEVERCIIEKVLQRHGGHSHDAAVRIIEEMKCNGTLRRDVWDSG